MISGAIGLDARRIDVIPDHKMNRFLRIGI